MADSVDQATIDYIRANVVREFQLPEAMSHRLRGDTAAAMRQDAAELRTELGLKPLQGGGERDEHGRFRTTDERLDMNRAIRAAAGR